MVVYRVRAVIAAVLMIAGAAVMAQVPTTAPATPPTTPATPATPSATRPATSAASQGGPAEAISANDILRQFPVSALVWVGKGRDVTVEGEVIEVRGGPVAPGAASANSGVRIVLIGPGQDEDEPAHITCTMDAGSEAAARKLKPGMRVRLTGTGGGLVLKDDRLELVNCHGLTEVEAGPVSSSMLVGRWRGSVTRTGNIPLPLQGGEGITTLSRVPRGPVEVDLTLRTGGRITQDIHDAMYLYRRHSGCWVLIQDDQGLQMHLVMKGMDPVDVPVKYDGQALTMNLPGMAELQLGESVTFRRIYGQRRYVDYVDLMDQTFGWIKSNVTLPDPTKLLENTMTFIEESMFEDRGFLLVYGQGLVKTRKVTLLCAVNGTFFKFEYTDAQAQRSGMQAMSSRFSPVRAHVDLLEPEVRLEALTLDGKNQLSLSKEITGKITMRGIVRVTGAKYALAMDHQFGVSLHYLETAPGADTETFTFKFGKPAAVMEQTNPLPLFFTVCRVAEGKMMAVSEPVAMLMDVVP